ncbi:MAG: hypothetical protein SGJ27_30495 [Candidatus Melainabacteria bacterium]|nr:hypothetical protein [Candidatus Melainabacteria bacterium]
MLNVSAIAPSRALENSLPEIPSKVSKLEGFAPEPWRVLSSATGDLNKDGLPDAALIVACNGNSGGPGSIGAGVAQRKLVVALKKKDGGYEKSAESDKATGPGVGPSAGIPSVEIKKGVLFVNHSCVAKSRYEYYHKYQLRKGQWILIGYTASTGDTKDLNDHQTIDVNTMTGEISSTCLSGNTTVKERLLELWAAPIVSDEPSPSDWGAPAVKLCGSTAKGAPSATLQAVHSAKKLFVKAQLDGDKHLTAEDVCLIDSRGHVIPPESSRATIYGYVVNSYDLAVHPLKELISKQESNGHPEPVLRLSVAVKSRSAGNQKLTTQGKKLPGAIFLSKNKGAPELKDVDVRAGDPVHPFLQYESM